MSHKLVVQIIAGYYTGDWYLNFETLDDLFHLHQNPYVLNYNTIQTPLFNSVLQCIVKIFLSLFLLLDPCR